MSANDFTAALMLFFVLGFLAGLILGFTWGRFK